MASTPLDILLRLQKINEEILEILSQDDEPKNWNYIFEEKRELVFRLQKISIETSPAELTHCQHLYQSLLQLEEQIEQKFQTERLRSLHNLWSGCQVNSTREPTQQQLPL